MKIVFMGTPRAAVASLERCLNRGHEVVAVYTQPDRPSGRGNKVTFSPVKEFSVARVLTVLQPEEIRTRDALDVFKSHAADIAVVVAYGRILPVSFLYAFPKGAINVHFSLLPKYRGSAPVNWAIANGESETGVTTMQMDEGLDTGPILMQRTTSIERDETSLELMTKLSSMGADLLSETLSRLEDIKPMPQEHQYATFAPMLKRDDGLIDWRMSAWAITNRVRGFQPFPAAFTRYRGARLMLWQVSAVANEVKEAWIAGQIIDAHGDNLLVECGDGSVLRVEEIQPEGRRRMAVRDFINGFEPQKGSILGA